MPEAERIVDYGREEIQGLNKRLAFGKPDYGRVFIILLPGKKPFVLLNETFQYFLQVPRRELGRSTGGLNRLDEFWLIHAFTPSIPPTVDRNNPVQPMG